MGSFAAFAAIVLLATEAAVAAEICRNLMAAHPFVAPAAVVLLATESAVAAERGRDLVTAHPLSTPAAVVLLVAEAAVVAEVGRVFGHRFKIIKTAQILLCLNSAYNFL